MFEIAAHPNSLTRITEHFMRVCWSTGVTVLVALMLTSCAELETHQYEGDGSRVISEKMIDAENAKVLEGIRSGLLQGVGAYRLTSGDVLDVLFLNSSRPMTSPYVIGVGDRLKVEFHFTEELPRLMLVRPDGYVTLPVKGDIRAIGRTPAELAEDIRRSLLDMYKTPKVTVTLEQQVSRLEELRVALAGADRGRAQKMVISPDGLVFLPFLPGLRVTGLTVDEAKDAINQRYRETIGPLEVNILLESVVGNRIFVFGEVQRPGMVQLAGNMSVLQAVASAGGVLPSGSLENVKVLYWSSDDKAPRLKTVNLEQLLNERSKEVDVDLHGQATIYVPPRNVTVVGRFIDQYLRQLFLFNGTSIGISYQK